MWVALGPFDGEVVGEAGFQKPKLLKPNSSYVVGRKDRPLLVNNKKVSHDHCEFIVGDHTIDDASNPSSRPLLEVVNRIKKVKMLSITRDGKEKNVEPSAKMELEHGDIVSLISGITITVEWRPLCAYSSTPRGKGSIPIDACASLGIKLVYTPHTEITHHLISHYVANLSTATSLLSLSRFVKPEWLREVLRLGNLPRHNEEATGTSLEDHFILPLESKFRPSFSPSLLPSQKKFEIWEPNEERVNLFNACRFICLHEKVREVDGEIKEAIHRGGGTLETFDIHSGVSKFNRALTRSQAKEGKKTVVVGDPDLMQAAIGSEDWGQFLAEATSFTLAILPPSKIIQAVLEVDVQVLFLSVSTDTEGSAAQQPRTLSPLPDVVPNTLSNEPSMESSSSSSQVAGPSRKLVRRTTSRSGSREPSIPPTFGSETVDESMARPRRGLTRRVAGGAPLITGLDDPSAVIDAVPNLETRKRSPPPSIYDFTAPTPARSSKLKRRVGVGGPDGQIGLESPALLSGIEETIREPPLKKFKALFEASNPNGPDAETFGLADSMPIDSSSQTQTQSDVQSRPLRSMGASNLAVLREEEEEATQSGLASSVGQRGHKRRLESVGEDIDMETVDHNGGSDTALPAAKKRAVENVNSVGRNDDAPMVLAATRAASKPPSTIAPAKDKRGAPAGKPDSDAAFLKAIASTKRGKKAEDAFDREFNQLKISKPEIDNRDPEEEWGLLAEFGDDSGLRGNFMTVVDMDLYQKDPNRQKNPANHSWDGKPNFKKFKKKVVGMPRSKVEVFLNEENDYGMGAAYWKGGNSQGPNQTQNTLFGSQMQSQINIESQRNSSKKPKNTPILDSDEEDQPQPLRKSRKLHLELDRLPLQEKRRPKPNKLRRLRKPSSWTPTRICRKSRKRTMKARVQQVGRRRTNADTAIKC
ncbi:hypothetical protein BDZ97DRAFT_1985838 [Flammula alnicola]|nr:hypothetical protein BDZ97DRAFT_1985838 [Flammula alnicola]